MSGGSNPIDVSANGGTPTVYETQECTVSGLLKATTRLRELALSGLSNCLADMARHTGFPASGVCLLATSAGDGFS
jgi:hypothetical protein